MEKMAIQDATTAQPTRKARTEPTPIGAIDRLDAIGQLLYGEHSKARHIMDRYGPNRTASQPGTSQLRKRDLFPKFADLVKIRAQ
jgi:hypothetical protein